MTPDLQAKARELRELSDKATAGEWRMSSLAPLYMIAGDDPTPICSLGEYNSDGTVDGEFENGDANAKFIVAAVNYVRDLLALGETQPHEERVALNLARSLERLHLAVKSLGQIKDGKTLFEHSPSKDAEAYAAWTDLDAAQKDAIVKLDGYRLWATPSPVRQAGMQPDYIEVRSTACHAGSDGDCGWDQCPQLHDGEPKKSGRDCPLLVELPSSGRNK